MVNGYFFDAAILAALGFSLFHQTTLGRSIMTTQEQVDAITNQLGRVYLEVTTQAEDLKAKIADVQAQLDAANVPAEQVDLTALTEAAQKLDDIVPDAPAAPADVPVDAPTDAPAADEAAPPF